MNLSVCLEHPPTLVVHLTPPPPSMQIKTGPWTITEDLKLEETPYGWDRSAHMIYVDQPINTGFSWSEDDQDRCYDEDCVSNDMLDFLIALWDARPDLACRDFFVTGESYAGHYVPAVSYLIYSAIKSGQLSPQHINFKGFAIGNGLTVPSIQYGAYADYAFDHGLITEEIRDQVNALYPTCQLALEACDDLGVAMECLAAVMLCQTTMFAPIMLLHPFMNVYDIRKTCDAPLCYAEFGRLDAYLNQPEVQEALGVNKTWEACNMDVHQDMMADWGHSFDESLPEMLADGVRVLVYAGNQDFICNVLGNRRWVDALRWGRWREWVAAENATWVVEGEKAGVVTEVGPLAFLDVDASGHMVPMDAPKNALDMITRFVGGESLGGERGQRELVLPSSTGRAKSFVTSTV